MNLGASLAEFGLHLHGIARLESSEAEALGHAGDGYEIGLVGNIGSSYWAHFSASPEFVDGAADPLDRWSRRVAQIVAGRHGLTPVYPFDGPPYHPFQRWASRARDLSASPIGVLMHPRYGLWHSFRFALLGRDFEPQAAEPAVESPCISCSAKPCLHSCPVDAFDAGGYDVDACAGYLRANPACECLQAGCRARHACPVAIDFQYPAEQSTFHLRAFLDARP